MLKLLSTLAVLSLAAPHHIGGAGCRCHPPTAARTRPHGLVRRASRPAIRGRLCLLVGSTARRPRCAKPVLAAFPFDQLLLGSPQDSVKHDWDIVATHYGDPPRTLDQGQWSALLKQWEEEGFVLEQSEWHHKQFIPPKDGPSRSLIDLKLHVKNHNKRLIVSGDLSVTWSERARRGRALYPRHYRRLEPDADRTPRRTHFRLFSRLGGRHRALASHRRRP